MKTLLERYKKTSKKEEDKDKAAPLPPSYEKARATAEGRKIGKEKDEKRK